MPPEQFGGRTVPASDLYSLGATLIYLVTGRHPAELPQENLRIQFESSVHLSPNLIDWLKWMIQPSLNRRLSSAEEALKALEQPRQQTDHSVLKQKPFGSQIQVRKDGKTVEIYIAPARFRSRILISKIMRDTNCLLPTLMGLIFCSVGLLSCFISVFSLIPGIIFFCAGWFLIVHISPALNIFFESIMVRIKKESLSWTYEWTHELISNWKKSQDALISKKDIKQLIYSNGYWQTTKIKKGTNTMLIPPTITIVAQGEHKFSVYHLSDPEMEWLAHEISEWSGVPITVKYGR
jgi:serine/threonine protein kinase